MKQLIAFDLDGTLAISKQSIDAEMAILLSRLMKQGAVAVISGGDWPQFEAQLVGKLPDSSDLSQVFLLPTSGTKLYRYDGGWRCVYVEALSDVEHEHILAALNTVISAQGLADAWCWGARIEDRGSQITFSALGQQAPPGPKLAWDPDFAKRKRLQAALMPMLPGFSVRIGGSTSIDITREGVDKGYGIIKLADEAAIPLRDMLFIGDALFPGGNDHAVIDAGVDCVAVRDVEETKRIIETILFCRSGLCGQR